MHRPTAAATNAASAAALSVDASAERDVHGDEVDGERVIADYDTPITAEWLTRAYHAIFKPFGREDVDLGFDPDDYPMW